MKKRGLSESDEEAAELEHVPTSHATLVACLYKGSKRRGEALEDFLARFEEAGYALPKSTLMRWTKGLREDGEALPPSGKRGRKSKLSDEHKRCLTGFVFDRQFSNQKTSLDDALRFCVSELQLECSPASLSRWLAKLGFSSRKMQTKSSGYTIDVDGTIEIAYGWLKKYHSDLYASQLCSVDCLFSGHRTTTHKSFVFSGGPPANFSGGICSYTALGVTCVFADGRYYPTILYTTDPLFDRSLNAGPVKKAKWDKLDRNFQKYKIDPSRIVFVSQLPGRGKKSIVPASADRVRDFFDRYEIEKDTIILSDGGKEFVDLEKLGFTRHIKYPPAVHQWLSPNDNRWHGAAKQKWRSMGIDFKDDGLALIALLYCLDETVGDARKWFQTNLQVRSESPSKEDVAKLIGSKKLIENRYLMECRRDYRIRARPDARGDDEDKFQDGLDGIYWN